MQTETEDGQLSLFAQDGASGRTCLAHIPAGNRQAKTIESSWNPSPELVSVPYLSLDLTPGNGNLLGESYWEILSPWRGGHWTLNTGLSPREGRVCTLSSILQAHVLPKYYLTKRACLGILRRAKERGKPLPPQLEMALKIQAGLIPLETIPRPPQASHINQREEVIDLGETAGALMATTNMQMQTFVSQERNSAEEYSPLAFAINQRKEVRDLGKTSAALTASQGMEMQTFISQASFAAGFCAGAGASAGGIGYTEELAPTLKASPSGNMMPSVLCLNDQGGRNMELSRDCVGTLRAQEHGHQPLVFANHGQDSRFSGPFDVSPTICAGAGEGGNNLPFAVEQDVAGTLCARDGKGADNVYAEQGKLVVESPLLIRRLVPLECELLQGFPPHWTDIPGASDTARYKALGNSIAIPCAEFVLGGIVKFVEMEGMRG